MDRTIMGTETEFGIFTRRPFLKMSGMEMGHVKQMLGLGTLVLGAKSNFRRNGSRFYLDHNVHPEYASAECDLLRDLIAQDKAGEKFAEAMRAYVHEQDKELGLQIFKNNVDMLGNTWGCHENYCTSRESDVIPDVLSFLAIRQLMIGTGGIGFDPLGSPAFILSPRSLFIVGEAKDVTLDNRPMISTRDEPLGDASRFRRLHVICGDSNMSEVSLFLKMGTTSLIIAMIEDGYPLDDLRVPFAPTILRETTLHPFGDNEVTLSSGRTLTAVELLREFWTRADVYVETHPTPDREEVIHVWGEVLDALEAHNVSALVSRLDWARKFSLIESAMARHHVDLLDDKIRYIDTMYHSTNPEVGLYYKLLSRGGMERMVTDADIETALTTPPQTTRAAVRGEYITELEERKIQFIGEWARFRRQSYNLPCVTDTALVHNDPFSTDRSAIAQDLAAIDLHRQSLALNGQSL